MSTNCQLVVFSNRAYNALIRESFDKDPVETGGILLGHVLDNGIWIVMEVLPPGKNSIFQPAYFEYDVEFVNYLAQSVANQYRRPLDLLGLWHRHPGSMDHFSSTDDGTNTTFARLNPMGVISGLVNIDPVFRLTMYHMDRPEGRIPGRPNYETVPVEVGDDLIPEEYFAMRYFDGEGSDLNPALSARQHTTAVRQVSNDDTNTDAKRLTDITTTLQERVDRQPYRATPKWVDDFFLFWRASKLKWLYILIALMAIAACVCTIKTCKDSVEDVSSWVNDHKDKKDADKKESDKKDSDKKDADKKDADKKDKGHKAPSLSMEKVTLTHPGDTHHPRFKDMDDVEKWRSSDTRVAIADDGVIVAVGEGRTIIEAIDDDNEILARYEVTVKFHTDEKEQPAPDEVLEEVKDISNPLLR